MSTEDKTPMNTQTVEQALTHSIRLVLGDDEALRNHRRMLTNEALTLQRAQDESPMLKTLDDDEYIAAANELAGMLKDWCEELCGLKGFQFFLTVLGQEIMTTALAFVDWRQMALDYIEEEAA